MDDEAMSLLQLSAVKPASSQRKKSKRDFNLSSFWAHGKRTTWPDMKYWPTSVQLPKMTVTRPIKIVEWTDFAFLSEKSVWDTPNCSFDNLYNYHMEKNGGVILDPDFDIS